MKGVSRMKPVSILLTVGISLICIPDFGCTQQTINSGPNFCGDEQQGTLLSCPLGSRCVEVSETVGGKSYIVQSCQLLDGRTYHTRKLERVAAPGLAGRHTATSEIRPFFG